MEASNSYFKNPNTILSGNPRGEELVKIKKADKKEYNLDKNKKLILITMGSLGAATINKKLIDEIAKFKNKEYEVLFVTGKKNFDEVSKKRFPSNVKALPYIENMGSVLKITDLIISRAGATIISEITALGIPSIIIPSPYVANNHQVMNAKFLKSNKASEIIYEEYFSTDLLISEIDNLMNNGGKYNEIAKASKKMGITNGASRIYKEIKKIID
jgi:UDP-N-acetylglucosamine--N-acetylmuramyl-(pentapeptide) pyrophosphoryl-undecaprenol N-acetylglucosamine transferase